MIEAALRRGEGSLSNTGALVVTTGKYTDQSPQDTFIVDTQGIHDRIAALRYWGKPVHSSPESNWLFKCMTLHTLHQHRIFLMGWIKGSRPYYPHILRFGYSNLILLTSQKRNCDSTLTEALI